MISKRLIVFLVSITAICTLISALMLYKIIKASQASNQETEISSTSSSLPVHHVSKAEMLKNWDNIMSWVESGKAGSAGGPDYELIPKLREMLKACVSDKEIQPRTERLLRYIETYETDWKDQRNRSSIVEIQKDMLRACP